MTSTARQRFEIVRILGEGGMGVVYEAFDRERGETVALKTMRKTDAEGIYRIKHEFRILADREHPNLVRLYDLFVEGDDCFFTMERVEGVEFGAYLRPGAALTQAKRLGRTITGPRLDEAALRHVLVGLLRGLASLHDAGLLHMDLKPANVMVTPQGRVVLLDLGLAADRHSAAGRRPPTYGGGTSTYMSPEQALGDEVLTPATDLYAVGAMLFEALTGQLPFEGPALRVLYAKTTEAPVPPSRLRADVPPDLDALAFALLARDPAQRPRLDEVMRRLQDSADRQPTGTWSSRGEPALHGRDAELAALFASADSTSPGRPSLTLVRGRSGIGKSTLLQHFARRVEVERQALVLEGRCHANESVAFRGLDGVIDGLSRMLAVLPEAEARSLLPRELGELGALFPVLRRVKPIASAYARRDPALRAPERTRSQGFAALRTLLRALGERQPVVLVLDDVQWADEDTARGLAELVGGESPPTMTWVLGARDEMASPLLRDFFEGDAHPALAGLPKRVIDLAPLDDEAIRSLAAAELDALGLASLAENVVTAAHGVPFAAHELVRFLRDTELGTEGLASVGSVDDVVRLRASLLDSDARNALDALAIAGEPVTPELLLRAAGLSDDARSPLDALRIRHFVRTTRSGTAVVLDTAHDRIRESLVEAMGPERRRDLHLSLATSLESLEVPPHDRLARHFAAAGSRVLARHHAVAAAERARAAMAFLRAADFYALAVECSESDARIPLLAERAQSLASAGRYGESANVWLEAASQTVGPSRREFRRRAAEAWLHSGRIDDGLDLLDEVAGEVGIHIPTSRFGLLWSVARERLRLWLRGFGFRLRRRDEVRSEDLERVRTLGAIAVQYAPLDLLRGIVPITRHLVAALDLGHPDEIVTAVGFEATVRGVLGFVSSAMQFAERLDALYAEHEDPRAKACASLVRSMVSFHEGDVRASLRHSDEALAALASSGSATLWETSLANYTTGFSALTSVRVAVFDRLVKAAEAREEEAGPYAEIRIRTAILPAYYLRIGRLDEVHRLASDGFWREATRRDVSLRGFTEIYSAWAMSYAGDPANALAMARRVRKSFVRNGSFRLTVGRGRCLIVLAAAAHALGDEASVHEARRAFGRPRNRLQRTFSLWLDALSAVARQDTEAAIESLDALRALGAETGNELAEAVACFALGRLRPGTAGDDARARFDAMMDGSGIVDPDRFFWATMSVGPAPSRLDG